MPLTHNVLLSSPRNTHVWTFINANGNGAAILWSGGQVTLGVKLVASDYDSGSLTWQWLPIGLADSAAGADSSNQWGDVGGATTLSATDGSRTARLGVGYLRPVLTGSTTPVLECHLV